MLLDRQGIVQSWLVPQPVLCCRGASHRPALRFQRARLPLEAQPVVAATPASLPWRADASLCSGWLVGAVGRPVLGWAALDRPRSAALVRRVGKVLAVGRTQQGSPAPVSPESSGRTLQSTELGQHSFLYFFDLELRTPPFSVERAKIDFRPGL